MAQEEISIRDLLHLCLSSDGEEHWRQFVQRTRPLIASVIINTVRRWKVPEPNLVDDLIQETYLKLFANDRKALRSIKNEHENTIFGFLKVVASNVVRDHFRRPQSKADETELSDAVLPAGQDVHERLEVSLKNQKVQEILRTLSSSAKYERDVASFWVSYQQGYTAQENSLVSALGL